MFDAFSRPITYLRVSVTDRCNLRCEYCMPESGAASCEHADVLSFGEIAAVVAYGARHGIRKVRLTGGEPLVRSGIVTLVKKLSEIDGITELTMTTNGQLLRRYAVPLKQAGLHRLNISLDSMDAAVFARITRGGQLACTLDGIVAAREAGFTGTKLNCVIVENVDEPDAQSVAAFGAREGVEVRFIRRMNTETGEFWAVQGGEGGNCRRCNRLRLSSIGDIHPCLFNDAAFSVRHLGIETAFRRALQFKPECGGRSSHAFYRIGG